MSLLPRLALLLGTVALASAAAAAPPAQAASPPASLLFVQDAASGTLTPVAHRPGRYTLRLHGVDPGALYFTDRPHRSTGVIGQPALLRALFDRQSPPNAAVEILGGQADQDVKAFTLSRPRYDAGHHTLTYQAQTLKRVSNAIAHYNGRLDRSLPRRFGAVSLFIDSAADWGNTCTATVENDSDGATFTIGAAFKWDTDHWDDDPGSKTWLRGSYWGWKSAGGFARGCNNTVTIYTGDGAIITITTGDPITGSNIHACTVNQQPTIPGANPYRCSPAAGSTLTGPVLDAHWSISQ
jgi:hypothetical protein